MSKPTALVAVLVLTAAVAAGTVLSGCGRESSKDSADAGDRLKALRSLPYTMLSSDIVDSTRSGVVLHLPDEAWPGYNLYAAGISGRVILMDMEGRTVHTWQDPREKPGPALLPRLLAGGDVLVIQKFSGLSRLDWNSNLVWHRAMIPHHDIAFLPDSTFYVLDSEVERYRGLMVKFPIIVHMNLDNEVLGTWQASEHMDDLAGNMDTRSFLDTILDRLLAEYGSREGRKRLPPELRDEDEGAAHTVHDYFHANTLSVIGYNPLAAQDGRFKPGNILTCFRNVNQVLILEAETMQVVWSWGEGELQWPHHPGMLENGNILIFDNGTERKYSRLVELNPVTGGIEWEYVADPPESFFTSTRGSCQRLPNGNTLICESNKGRFFEITSEGKTVWEWLNPSITDGRRELIYRVERLPASLVEPLLSQS
jgi:hypothetical protein